MVAFSSVLHHIADRRRRPRRSGARPAAGRSGLRLRSQPPASGHAALPAPEEPLLSRRRGEPRRATACCRGRCARTSRRRASARSASVASRTSPTARWRPKGFDALLSLYNRADWLWEKVGLGRWFGTFVVTWGAQAVSDPALRYSVVVPVFHEAENIGPFCRAVRESFPPGYELLVCYDMEEDRTLPALAALPADDEAAGCSPRPQHSGPRRALRHRGRDAAPRVRPVVVVTMVGPLGRLPDRGGDGGPRRGGGGGGLRQPLHAGRPADRRAPGSRGCSAAPPA